MQSDAYPNRPSGFRRIDFIHGGGSKGRRLITIKQSALIGKCQLVDSRFKILRTKKRVMSDDCGFLTVTQLGGDENSL
jgi:hypothetical protein